MEWIEVDLDYIDQIAAQAGSTLVAVGPPRVSLINPITKAFFSVNLTFDLFSAIPQLTQDLKLLGQVQGISFMASRSRAPMAEIGKERPLIVSTMQTMVQISLNRLITVGGNFLAKLKGGVSTNKVNTDLHTNTTLTPFGLAVFFLNDINTEPIARLYAENCKLVAMGTSVATGQGVVIEGVQIIGARIVQADTTRGDDLWEY